MPTSTNVTNLKINELKEAQYDTAVQQGVIGANELSILTDVDAGQVIQVSTLPTASADELGNIYQFVGTTDANYTNGYFYKCVSDGATPAVYSWTAVEVQASSGGLPDQTGQSGKFLTTDGTDASWSDTLGITLKSSATTPLTVVRDTYNHSISFSGSYAAPTIDLFSGTVTNRPTINLPKVSAVEVTSGSFKKQSNDGGFSLPRGSGYISVQVNTMPTAGSVFLGNVVQYIGTTDSTYTHGHLYECVSDGQTPATYSWTEVQLGGGGSLPSQTGNSGKFLTTDGSSASWGDALVNKADTSVNNTTLFVSNTTTGNTYGFSTIIGMGAFATGVQSVSVGYGASASRYGVAIGRDSGSVGDYAISIGRGTRANANYSIQIGEGQNSDANTFKVGNANGNFEMMDANGNLPADRLAFTTGLADGNYRLRLTIASGVPTLSWVAE